MAKWSRKSEHHHALNAARRARRRGDIAAAERWLKHADRDLAHWMRCEDAFHREMMREEERYRKRVETARKLAQRQQPPIDYFGQGQPAGPGWEDNIY